MSTRKDQSGKLSFRNFSPFYEKAMTDAKRDENFLKIMAKDIEKRKMISYGQLTAAQRIVEKDLFQLKQAKQKNKEMSLRRARSNTGKDETRRESLFNVLYNSLATIGHR